MNIKSLDYIPSVRVTLDYNYVNIKPKFMKRSKFIPGETYIPASGKVFDEDEINNAIEAARDGWWTEGRFAKQFENDFSKFLAVRYVSLVNSGSSANLVALASLTSRVFGERRLKPGDEFITGAVAFPTTVNPGIQYGLTPVFVDCDLKTLNLDANQIEKAINKKTKLVMVAHTLGIPFDLEKIVALCKKYHLWLIEDCCDALGSKYDGKLVGIYGDIATFSFYPAHQLCMGEAGAAITNNSLIHRSIRQFRDWGRDCWCDTGKDNTCGKRFGWKMGDLPFGYDHKYIYSQIGYNLKLTDFQAAIGVAQLKKLPRFIGKRKENYRKLYEFFKKYSINPNDKILMSNQIQNPNVKNNLKLNNLGFKNSDLIRNSKLGIRNSRKFFHLIETSESQDPCWFGFPVIVNPEAPFTRNELTEYLEANKIGTRNVFSGNLLRHPAYKNIRYKTAGKIINADIIMNHAFWLGVFPGIGDGQIKYVKQTLRKFLNRYL